MIKRVVDEKVLMAVENAINKLVKEQTYVLRLKLDTAEMVIEKLRARIEMLEAEQEEP